MKGIFILLTSLLVAVGEAGKWNPKIIHTQPQFFPHHGSKRVELQYGPFPVYSMAYGDGMNDFFAFEAELPCTDCTLTYMSATLQYSDGSPANANTSLWLHHVVMINHANPDTVCERHFYGEGQRFFASGNERTPADISLNGTVPVGYYLASNAINTVILELMNQGMTTQRGVLSVTMEYVPGFPSDFYHAVPMWLDITGCGQSDKPPATNTTFHYSSPPWKADFAGAFVGMGGHIHDGGTNLEIFQNKKEICNSVAYYGQTPGYWDAPGTSMTMPMDPNFAPMDQISTMTTCHAPIAPIKPGDVMGLTAYYNFTEYQPMLGLKGKPTDIMGIALIYAALDMTEEKMETFVGSKIEPLIKTPEPTTVASMDMSMGGTNQPEMGAMTMSCVPLRDSPGTITTIGVNMQSRRIAMDYLMAILNDACLKPWSEAYVRYFWYGILVVTALFGLTRVVQWFKVSLRKQNWASGKSTSGSTAPTATAARLVRSVSYVQMTPKFAPRVVSVPPFGTLILIGGYLGFLLALEFINSSTGDNQTWQYRGVRAGWLSVGQIPLIVLLASKRNFIELFTGISYERLNVLHRWTARGLLLTTSMHFGFQSYGWAKAGVMNLEWSTDSCPPTGMGAYALVLWMNLSTLAPFRNFSYEFFVVQHIVTFMGLIIAVMIHIPPTALFARTYIYIAIGLYVASRALQTAFYAVNNFPANKARITALTDQVTRISIKSTTLKSWRPGTFVLVSIPRFGVLQSHPATISSTPSSHNGDVILYLKNRGGFTKRISGQSAHSRDHIALIDGPYGGRQADLAAYRTVALIAGSTGVSFTLPILLDIASRASATKLPIEHIHFIWTSKDGNFISSLRRDLEYALKELSANGITVAMHIHVTRDFSEAVSEKSETTSTDSSSDLGQDVEKKDATISQTRSTSSGSITVSSSKHAITVVSGRPDIKRLLSNVITQSRTEIGVASCGPLSLSSDIRNTVAGLQFRTSNDVYLHVEGFSW